MNKKGCIYLFHQLKKTEKNTYSGSHRGRGGVGVRKIKLYYEWSRQADIAKYANYHIKNIFPELQSFKNCDLPVITVYPVYPKTAPMFLLDKTT